jgi:hypothetical protein
VRRQCRLIAKIRAASPNWVIGRPRLFTEIRSFLLLRPGGDRMPRMHKRVSKFCAALLLSCSVAACGGGSGGGSSLVDDAVASVLTFLSGGAFRDLDSLVVALQGDQLVIEDFGDSALGTNATVLPLRSALVSGISCGATSCTGQVLVPRITNGVLQGVTRETGTMAKLDENSFSLSSPSLGTKTYTKSTSPAPSGTTLAKSATCRQWWDAIGNRPLTWVSANPSFGDVSSTTVTFTGDYSNATQRWRIDGPAFPRADAPGFDHLPSRTGELRLADNWPTQNLCRFLMQWDTGGDVYVIWAFSLSGDRMRFVLNPITENTPLEWVFKVN